MGIKFCSQSGKLTRRDAEIPEASAGKNGEKYRQNFAYIPAFRVL